MPSATTMRLVKSRQTESTNASAILATQAAAFNAQMGEKAINLYFTSYSQLGCKVTLIISFFSEMEHLQSQLVSSLPLSS